MIRTIRAVAATGLLATTFATTFAVISATPAAAAAELSKEESCKYQGQVMTAVQQARLDRVAETEAEATILASEPDWPENFSKAIPQLVAHVYQMKRRDLKQNELGPIFEAQCLESWEQIQAMRQGMTGN